MRKKSTWYTWQPNSYPVQRCPRAGKRETPSSTASRSPPSFFRVDNAKRTNQSEVDTFLSHKNKPSFNLPPAGSAETAGNKWVCRQRGIAVKSRAAASFPRDGWSGWSRVIFALLLFCFLSLSPKLFSFHCAHLCVLERGADKKKDCDLWFIPQFTSKRSKPSTSRDRLKYLLFNQMLWLKIPADTHTPGL